MLFTYPLIVHVDKDGIWGEFPDLQGCSTYGETINEVLKNASEAMDLYVYGELEDGQKLPKATDIKEFKTLDENSFATLIQVDVDLLQNSKSVKKTLTIPLWLDKQATSKHVNFSQALQEILIQKI